MALEYVAQEALRAGQMSGTISPKSCKRCRASPSRSPTLAAAATTATTTAPEPLVAIRAVFVKPESARQQISGNRFTFLWPWADSSLVSTISSIFGQSMQALAAAAIANMLHPIREIRAIWGVTAEESMEDNGVVDGPKANQVFLRDSDEAVKGWLVRTSHLVDLPVFIVYRRPEADGRPDTPISGDRPFFLRTALAPRESEVYYVISEGEDEELVALPKEPRTFAWTRLGLATKERIFGICIIRQERLLRVLRALARGFYGDWQDTDVQEEDVTWMADNRYLVDPPEPGTEEVPHY